MLWILSIRRGHCTRRTGSQWWALRLFVANKLQFPPFKSGPIKRIFEPCDDYPTNLWWLTLLLCQLLDYFSHENADRAHHLKKGDSGWTRQQRPTLKIVKTASLLWNLSDPAVDILNHLPTPFGTDLTPKGGISLDADSVEVDVFGGKLTGYPDPDACPMVLGHIYLHRNPQKITQFCR